MPGLTNIQRRFMKNANLGGRNPKPVTPNPIIFNKVNEMYAIRGKEKIVGLWLLGVSASIFGIVVLGGATRLTKSGLSMTKWKPLTLKPPMSQKEWEEEFVEYKKFPEYSIVHKDITLDGFKRIYYFEWSHRIVGRSIGIIFFVPMIYFWARGYLQSRLKLTLGSLFLLGGLQGAIGWWMVKSGLVDKNKTSEVDKTPRVSPYRLATHAGFAYFLYGVCFWQSLTLLRRPMESYINLENLGSHNLMRKSLFRLTHLIFPLVFITGFFTAGISGGNACNTFPFVGDNYFISQKHMIGDIPFWQNFTENKLVVQVVHRTLASTFLLFGSYSLLRIMRLPHLSKVAQRGALAAFLAMWMQACIGVTSIWNNVPIELASLHQIGAMVTLTAFTFAMHTCRKSDMRHLKNLLGKLKGEDPKRYLEMTKNLTNLGKDRREIKQFSKIKQELEGGIKK